MLDTSSALSVLVLLHKVFFDLHVQNDSLFVLYIFVEYNCHDNTLFSLKEEVLGTF